MLVKAQNDLLVITPSVNRATQDSQPESLVVATLAEMHNQLVWLKEIMYLCSVLLACLIGHNQRAVKVLTKGP